MYLTIPSEFIYSKVNFSSLAHFTTIWTTVGGGGEGDKGDDSHQFHGLHLLEFVLKDFDIVVSSLPVVHLPDVHPHVGQTARPAKKSFD